MSKDQKDSVNSFLGKGEKISDNFVSMFYSEALVNKIENLDFMKSLINSSFIKGLNDFGKGWFKQVFVFFGYLAIIFGLIGFVLDVIGLLDTLGYVRGVISLVMQMIMSLVTVITGFGMIKFKKWYPFVVIVSYVGQVIVTLAFPIYTYGYGYGRGGSVGYIVFSLLLFVIGYALILKNKELFKN